MNVNMKYLIVFFGALLCLSGCGESPISDHDTAQTPQASPAKAKQSETTPDSSPQKATDSETPESLRCDLEFSKVSLCAQMTWIQGPAWNENLEEPMEVRLEFWDKSSKQRKDLDYEVDFDSAMPTMNNHSLAAKPRVDRENSPKGAYSVNNIRISCLGGNWNFFFQLKDRGALIDQAKYIWVRDEHLVR